MTLEEKWAIQTKLLKKIKKENNNDKKWFRTYTINRHS